MQSIDLTKLAMDKEIIFVYNSPDDPISLVIGYLHKKVSPDTYECNLCKLTYGVTMNPKWKAYIASLKHKITFLHSNEFKKEYPDLADTPLPTAFIKDESGMRVLVTRAEMNEPKDMDSLIELMKRKL